MQSRGNRLPPYATGIQRYNIHTTILECILVSALPMWMNVAVCMSAHVHKHM